MRKAMKFDKYLRDNGITFFDKHDHDDETVIYSSGHTISGNRIGFFILIDDSVYTILRGRLMRLDKPAKREEILYLLNQLNCRNNVIKFELTDKDDIDFSVPYIAMDEDFSPEVIMGVTMNIIREVEQDYAKIMRVIWS